METGDDFGDGWLPTLDTNLKVTSGNMIMYKHFEKPMNSNVTLQMDTAMGEDPKMKCLANDLIRRLSNTCERLDNEERIKVVDDYSQKLINSGYAIKQVRRIILSGLKGYERILRESKKDGGRNLHRSAKESSHGRGKKKLLGRSEWFRNKAKSQPDSSDSGVGCDQVNTPPRMERGHGKKSCAKPNPTGAKIRTVLFVEQTRGGRLMKALKEVEARLSGMLGFRTKIVERGGTSLKDLLPNTNPWAGSSCGRTDCVTCNQGVEEIPDCTRRSLVYENICLDCNPGAAKKGDLKEVNVQVPSLYVGETCRSVQERAKEHWNDYRRGCKDSHILKHWVLHHNSEGEPHFIMKVVQYHRSALSRQVGEAIRIQKRGSTLNSKAGYNRSALTRLTLDIGEDEVTKEWEKGIEKDYTTGMFRKRKELDRRDMVRAGNAGYTPEEGKRKADPETAGAGEGRSKKKRKYEVIKGGWGEKASELKDAENKQCENDEPKFENECVNEEPSIKVKQSKPITKSKTWTKLNNGLYGWRRMPTVKRRCAPSRAPSVGRQSGESSSLESISVSADSNSSRENPTVTAKEAHFNGCGTAQAGFEKLDSCRPGQLIDKEKQLKNKFGREEHKRGAPRPRPSGGIRGQGK